MPTRSSLPSPEPSSFPAGPPVFPHLVTVMSVLSLQIQGCRSQDLYVGRWVLTAPKATRGSTAPIARVWSAGDPGGQVVMAGGVSQGERERSLTKVEPSSVCSSLLPPYGPSYNDQTAHHRHQ